MSVCYKLLAPENLSLSLLFHGDQSYTIYCGGKISILWIFHCTLLRFPPACNMVEQRSGLGLRAWTCVPLQSALLLVTVHAGCSLTGAVCLSGLTGARLQTSTQSICQSPSISEWLPPGQRLASSRPLEGSMSVFRVRHVTLMTFSRFDYSRVFQ